MNRSITTVIDPLLCNGCGRCVQVCPKETISIRGGKASVTGADSINCGHCESVCPTGAIKVGALDPEMSNYHHFKSSEKWMPPGQFDTGELARLFRSVRSCRNYAQTPVARTLLEDLVKIGITAPSGGNSQLWAFTILSEHSAVVALAERIILFFEKTNQLAKKNRLRYLLKFLGKPELEKYYLNHYATMAQALAYYRENSRDLLFHAAPAAIVVSVKDGASCPDEDALLAVGRIQLAAHCLGLGSCLIGFAIKAMRNDPEIKHFINIPKDETPYAVMTLGYPTEVYQRVMGRQKTTIRYFTPSPP